MNIALASSKLFVVCLSLVFFFFNDTATTEIYTLSLHDALPILLLSACGQPPPGRGAGELGVAGNGARSEEHTSELQSQSNLVCRLLLEKKKKTVERTGEPSDRHKSKANVHFFVRKSHPDPSRCI